MFNNVGLIYLRKIVNLDLTYIYLHEQRINEIYIITFT